MIKSDTWNDDLKRGKDGEKEARAILERHNWKTEDISSSSYGISCDCDLLVYRDGRKDETERVVEVKFSPLTAKYGNILIETFNVNNETHDYQGWWYYSDAQHFAFLWEGNLHIVTREKLEELLENNYYPIITVPDGKAYRIPASDVDWDIIFN